MSSRKNYNSIVFLTVYLGLVLVGASPQIIAQAATTRQFDIKTEFVVEDDLDKKPDEDNSLSEYSSAVRDLYQLAGDFSERSEHRLGGENYNFDCAFAVRARFVEKIDCRGANGLYSRAFISPLKKINVIFPQFGENDSEKSQASLTLSETQFFLKLAYKLASLAEAEAFSKLYNDRLSRAAIANLADSNKVVYQNTRISFKDDQVFIVTQLPRAALDDSPAEKSCTLSGGAETE